MKKGMYVMAKKINVGVDLTSIKAIFEKENTNKSKLGLALVDRAIFMQETLKELEKKVEEDGVVTEMCQGKYNIQRANPALQAHNQTIKNFASVVKQLNDMLPNENKVEDEFESFE